MRLRSLPPGSSPPRRRRTLRTIQLLPTLMTAGNLVVGMLACAYMIDAGGASSDKVEMLYERAAWLIFIGMFLDGLDGRVARMTGTTSAFGAQLDSLADVVTFGMAPALIAKSVLGAAFTEVPTRIAFGLCLVYALGAAFRLARYNVESERLSREGRPHVTRTFRGLPSPAAAGVLASLVLLRHEYGVIDTLHVIEWAILVVVPVLGLLMISRMPFSHVLNRYFDRRRAHPATVVVLILLVYLVVAHFVETVAGLFLFYALSGPFLTLTHRLWGFPAYVEQEDGDEEEDEELVLDDDDAGSGQRGDPPEGGVPPWDGHRRRAVTSVRAFVGLGSNEGDPLEQLTAAFAALDRDGLRVAGAGRLAWSAFVGGAGAPVLNTVAELRTALDPRALLERLLAIEAQAGRVRDGRPGRALDLDLLAYGDVVLDEPGLTLPHPRFRARRFVLEPWVEVAPLYVVPGTGATVLEHAATRMRDADGPELPLDPVAHPPFADRHAPCAVLPDHAALTAWRDAQRGTVGVVMTMGALHVGHAALVQRAAAECDAVVATVFVNPTQFAPGEDLARYPRTFDADVALLRHHGASAVYAPAVEDLYPDGPAATLDPRGAAQGLEGAQRPTHFGGVATVVTRLWRRTRAQRSYFGRKDAQQLAVLEQVKREQGLEVDVVACPTVRAIDSLALSSRNRYLNEETRSRARELSATLRSIAEHVARSRADRQELARLCASARERLERAGLDVDYIHVVDPRTMAIQTTLRGPALAVAAVRLGSVRLLDNRWLAPPLSEVAS